MKTILGVLVFMLVYGHAVCESELFPISIFKDIAQDQNDYVVNNDTEPAQKKAVPLEPEVAEDLKKIKGIVDKYGFLKHDSKDSWVSQPTFEEVLGNKELTSKFLENGAEMETFFKTNNDWDTMKNTRKRLGLLYITGARYVYVTYILYILSEKKLKTKLIPCATTKDGKYQIPVSGVCFPPPYGSATCTSDYDVGLIGKYAGILTQEFNDYFQAVYGKPSEVVFDTNIYAFTLEYSLPNIFHGLVAAKFVEVVLEKEKQIKYKMQELAGAYFKVYKYNDAFFQTLVKGARDTMKKDSKPLENLNHYLTKFSELPVKLRVQDFKDGAAELRTSHNAKYQELVATMSKKGGYDPELLSTLSVALIYAAEAYHTRGAIRHVVGGTQMKKIDLSAYTKDLSTIADLWVSMIENWGEANKEYNHYSNLPMIPCLIKMSKYMRRMFSAMRMIRSRLSQPQGLVTFGQQLGDPEHVSTELLNYKKEGNFKGYLEKTEMLDIKAFFEQFGCNKAVENLENLQEPLPATCLANINAKVNDYNMKLAAPHK